LLSPTIVQFCIIQYCKYCQTLLVQTHTEVSLNQVSPTHFSPPYDLLSTLILYFYAVSFSPFFRSSICTMLLWISFRNCCGSHHAAVHTAVISEFGMVVVLVPLRPFLLCCLHVPSLPRKISISWGSWPKLYPKMIICWERLFQATVTYGQIGVYIISTSWTWSIGYECTLSWHLCSTWTCAVRVFLLSFHSSKIKWLYVIFLESTQNVELYSNTQMIAPNICLWCQICHWWGGMPTVIRSLHSHATSYISKGWMNKYSHLNINSIFFIICVDIITISLILYKH